MSCIKHGRFIEIHVTRPKELRAEANLFTGENKTQE